MTYKEISYLYSNLCFYVSTVFTKKVIPHRVYCKTQYLWKFVMCEIFHAVSVLTGIFVL